MSSRRIAFVCTPICVASLLLAVPSGLLAQSAGCNAHELTASLTSTDHAYAAAMDLARILGSRGFAVQCVLRSKMANLFEGLDGAALFRTDRGDFEALFLLKPQTFEDLAVIEHGENGWYFYSFEGRPKPWPANRIESPRQIFFVRDLNRFLIAYSSDTARQLRTALSRR